MQRWAQDANDAFRSAMRRGRGRLLDEVIIPFGEVRLNIIDDPDNTVLRTLLQAQPLCEAGEEPLGGDYDLLPQCRPADGEEAFVERLAARWREEPRQVWRQLMPEDIEPYTADIPLDEFIESQSGEDWNVRIGWRAGRWTVGAVRLFFAICLAAQCVAGLALVGLLAARNVRELLRWLGTPLVLAGGLTLILAFLLLMAGEVGLAFGWWDTTTEAIEEALLDTGAACVAELWQPMLWQGALLLLIGGGLWALSFAFPPRREPVRTSAPPEPAPESTPAEDMVPLEQEQVEAEEATRPGVGEEAADGTPSDAVKQAEAVEATEAPEEVETSEAPEEDKSGQT
jgi:hypothetical protein